MDFLNHYTVGKYPPEDALKQLSSANQPICRRQLTATYVNLVARISASPTTSTNSSITEGTERREQSQCRQQEGKQMLTLLLLPKNAHPHNLLPFSKTYSTFSSYTDPPHPLPKDPECVCVMRWGIKKTKQQDRPFLFLKKD